MLAYCGQRAQTALQNLQGNWIRSLWIASTRFNLNAESELQSLSELQFLTSEINTVSSALSWNGGATARAGYRCDSSTATCIVLRRLPFPSH